VLDIPSKLEEVAAMIAKIDVPVRQVLIEARIVEADDKFGRALGVKLGSATCAACAAASRATRRRQQLPDRSAATIERRRADAADAQHGDQLPAGRSSSTCRPARHDQHASAATFALSLFSATANRFLNLELSALEADGKGKIVSSPRVITADQIKA
jgi:type IV pilus assembly protein PilQ